MLQLGIPPAVAMQNGRIASLLRLGALLLSVHVAFAQELPVESNSIWKHVAIVVAGAAGVGVLLLSWQLVMKGISSKGVGARKRGRHTSKSKQRGTVAVGPPPVPTVSNHFTITVVPDDTDDVPFIDLESPTNTMTGKMSLDEKTMTGKLSSETLNSSLKVVQISPSPSNSGEDGAITSAPPSTSSNSKGSGVTKKSSNLPGQDSAPGSVASTSKKSLKTAKSQNSKKCLKIAKAPAQKGSKDTADQPMSKMSSIQSGAVSFHRANSLEEMCE